jgi:hypothetical protein
VRDRQNDLIIGRLVETGSDKWGGMDIGERRMNNIRLVRG